MLKNYDIIRITERHVDARKTGVYRPVPIRNRKGLIVALHCGYTFEHLVKNIEDNYCSIFSILLIKYFRIATIGYRTSMFKGFQEIINKKNK
jgi:hypothetical protein